MSFRSEMANLTFQNEEGKFQERSRKQGGKRDENGGRKRISRVRARARLLPRLVAASKPRDEFSE